MFASGGLGEKGVPRAVICVFAGVGVYATVEAEAVLKTVAMRRENISITLQALINPLDIRRGSRTVPKLRCQAAHQLDQREGAESEKSKLATYVEKRAHGVAERRKFTAGHVASRTHFAEVG